MVEPVKEADAPTMARQMLLVLVGANRKERLAGSARKEAIVLESYALYSTELTDEERELGFELVEVPNSNAEFANRAAIAAVAYRFTEVDQIVKMNVPVIGGYSYRHERLRPSRAGESSWVPVGAFVFPTAEQTLNSVGSASPRLALCH